MNTVVPDHKCSVVVRKLLSSIRDLLIISLDSCVATLGEPVTILVLTSE